MSAAKDHFSKKFHLTSLRILLRSCYTAVLPVFGSCNIVEEDAATVTTPLQQIVFHISSPCSGSGLETASASSSLLYNSLDIFIYDLPSGALDTYQHIDSPGDGAVLINSSTGRKRAVFVANAPVSMFSYSDVVSYDSMAEVLTDLCDENPSAPVMSAVVELETPANRIPTVVLQPVMSCISVEHVSVDFYDRMYPDAVLEDIRLYLTNAASLCPVNSFSPGRLRGVMNVGGLDSLSVGRMKHPEILLIKGNLGIYSRARVLNARLYCYPRDCSADASDFGPGPTRLVLDALIGGVRYYYPIDIADGKIERGFRYIYRISITRTGSLSPEIPCSPEAVSFTVEKSDWNEYEDEVVE